MSESIERPPGRTAARELRRFVDYMYERNAGDPHWVPPLRIGEHERLNPEEEPVLRSRGRRAAAGVARRRRRRPDRGDRRSAAPRDAPRQRRRCSASSRLRTRDVAARAAGRGRSLGAARGRARVRGPISPSLNEMCGPADRRLRHRPDAADAAQPARVRARRSKRPATPRSRTCSRGSTICGSRCGRCSCGRRSGCANKHGITIRPLNLASSRARSSGCARIYCSAWERNWGFVAPTDAEFRRHRQGAEADFRSALHGVRRSRRPDGRVRGRRARHQPGAERHSGRLLPPA